VEEETVNCENCGREVPRTLYCIYCGSALYETEEGLVKPAPALNPEEPGSEKAEPEKSLADPVQSDIGSASETATEPEPAWAEAVDPEIVELMDEIKKNHIWKVRLCGILCDSEVSEEVFTKVSEEYINRIVQLNKVRNEKISYYREELEERKAELEDAEKRLEELNVRVAVGQISDADTSAQTPELEQRIEELSEEASRLSAQLSHLNNLMTGSPPKEIFDLEKTARRCLDSLDDLIADGKISDETGRDIQGDLEATLDIFDGIIGEKKQREKRLRDELATLEARYKVGEINISEFETQKQRVNGELERVWL